MLLTANKIHDGHQFLPQGSVIEAKEDGTIITIHEELQSDDIRFYNGILCPGFVNAHCHTELSHLKGYFKEGKGLIPFLQQVPLHRGNFTEEQKATARRDACHEMLTNGIVAVGDIANVADSIDLRALDELHIHSFIECIGFSEDHAEQRMEAFQKVWQEFAAQKQQSKMLRQSLVPHAPYSVSEALFHLIDQQDSVALICIHNQESMAEDEYYRTKTGQVKELLQGFGISDDFFQPSGRSSLQTFSEWLSPSHPMIFVHNTFSTIDDVTFAQNRFKESYWCLCPNANIYLERHLPDVMMLMEADATICIGTDSLASNHQLSVLSELITLKQNFPALTWEALLRWGTANGARALQMSEKIGSITPGKQPGILHIQHIEEAPVLKRVL